jgi:hypothetical protein
MTNAGVSHNVEEAERRFGSEIVEWLGKKAAQHKFDHLVIFAPPRMLGVIRTVPLGSLKGQVEELKGDLMRLKPGQLADHPMIRALVIPQLRDEGPATDVAPISAPGTAGNGRPGCTAVNAHDEMGRN